MALPFPHPSALLPPGFTLSRCTPADVSEMADVFIKAFSRNAEFTAWWAPSAEAMRAWYGKRAEGRFADAGTQQLKVVDERAAGGPRLVAFAKWDPPPRLRGLRPGFVTYDAAGAEVAAPHGEGPAKRQPETKTLRPPAGANVALFEEFFAGLAAMGQKWNSSDKLILSVICTDPAYHGRGIAAAMIRSVLAVADAEGVPAYLEALPLAAPLYRRLGFADVDRLECDLAKAGRQGKAVLTVMVREPGAGDV